MLKRNMDESLRRLERQLAASPDDADLAGRILWAAERAGDLRLARMATSALESAGKYPARYRFRQSMGAEEHITRGAGSEAVEEWLCDFTMSEFALWDAFDHRAVGEFREVIGVSDRVIRLNDEAMVSIWERLSRARPSSSWPFSRRRRPHADDHVRFWLFRSRLDYAAFVNELESTSDTLTLENPPAPPIKWKNVHLDNHHGQDDFVLGAMDPATDELLGHLHYTIFRKRIHINLVETEDAHRRKGVGRALLTQLAVLYPHLPILPGVRTDMGEPLWQDFARSRRQTRRWAEASEREAARRDRERRRNSDADLRSLRRAATVGAPSDIARFLIALKRSGATDSQVYDEILVLSPPAGFVPRELVERLDEQAIDTRIWPREDDEPREAIARRLHMAVTGITQNSILGVVVRDDPREIMAAAEAGDLSPVAKLWGPQGPGVYAYGFVNRKIVADNSSNYWRWKSLLSREQILEFTSAVETRLADHRRTGYVTEGEADYVRRAIRDLREPGQNMIVERVFDNLVSTVFGQPYNMDLEEMLDGLGIEIEQPIHLQIELAGRFAPRELINDLSGPRGPRNLWINSFGGDDVYREPWCRVDVLDNLLLSQLGFHGSFISAGSFRGTPGFCVWDARAIRRIGDWVNPNDPPGDARRFTAANPGRTRAWRRRP